MSDQREPATTAIEAPDEVRVRRALLTVSDKRGIVDFARGLAELGVEIVSTGGTAQELRRAGLDVRAVEGYTGFPEILDGRVKTLNPRIHAGILAVRSDPAHAETLRQLEIEPIDLVCVNLYPFERVAARRGVSDREVIENIDIGGPTLIRAAAKNHAFCAVVVSPESYDAVLEELREQDGAISFRTREALAAEAFAYTARYEAAISRWFSGREEEFPQHATFAFEKVLDLAYGENPHQRAAYYAEVGTRSHLLSMVSKLHGRDLSFNNLLDLDSGRRVVEEFELPAAVIIKHNNPCGCAVAANLRDAFEKALECDPQSAFGGVYCFNRSVDAALAKRLHELFVELVFAPGYDDEALELLMRKPNVRILWNQERRRALAGEHDFKRVRGGILVQDRDSGLEPREQMRVVTTARPTEEQWGDLLFAMRVCKHVRSNAIVLARNGATVGIGAGQMSRVDSVRIALEKARIAGLDVAGAVMASDAFFPFPDGPELAMEAGVSAIIQPGGSQRDPEVIAACDRRGVPMVFTQRRHFKH